MPGPMDGLMNFFTKPQASAVGTNGQTPPQGQNQQGQNGQAPQQGQPNPNAIDPNNPNAQGSSDPNAQQSPEVLYKGLFDDPIPDASAETEPEYKINPDTLQKASAGLDFFRDMPQEIVDKLQSGENLTGQDFMTAINHVGRRVYATTMEHQSAVTGKFVGLHSKYSLKGVPNSVKEQLTMSQIQNDPVANNPIIRDQLTAIGKRLQGRYPDASPEWIAKQSKDYFVTMAKAMNPEAFASGDSNGQRGGKEPQTVDWDEFMKT